MSELLTWQDAWLLKIDVLDADHREMVRLINRLVDPAEVLPLPQRLGELIAHLRRHFHLELAFLRAIDYPDLDDHAREHAMQLAEFVDLSRSLAASSAAVIDAAEMAAIKQWFFNHVIAEDKRFAAYYREEVCGG